VVDNAGGCGIVLMHLSKARCRYARGTNYADALVLHGAIWSTETAGILEKGDSYLYPSSEHQIQAASPLG
jgi:hypothetical protein